MYHQIYALERITTMGGDLALTSILLSNTPAMQFDGNNWTAILRENYVSIDEDRLRSMVLSFEQRRDPYWRIWSANCGLETLYSNADWVPSAYLESTKLGLARMALHMEMARNRPYGRISHPAK
jgi:hypothetical protein